MTERTINCNRCGEALEKEPHGNKRYHDHCYSQQKKERSIRQHAAKSLKADPLWRNEKVLRELFYKYGPDHEVDFDELESEGFDFELELEQRDEAGEDVYFIHHFGFILLDNNHIVIFKI